MLSTLSRRTKWANICCVLLIQPKIINLNHKGKANERVIVKLCYMVVNLVSINKGGIQAKCICKQDPEVNIWA